MSSGLFARLEVQNVRDGSCLTGSCLRRMIMLLFPDIDKTGPVALKT